MFQKMKKMIHLLNNETNYAELYANQILNGEIEASEMIKLACQRHIDDLERSKSDDFKYYFNNEMANKAIKNIELLPAEDGSDLELALFQKWIVASLEGWRTKGTDYKRFRKAYISMARKNGKTFLAAGLGMITLLTEKHPAMGRRVLFTANELKQAKISYEMLRVGLNKLTEQSKSLRKRLKIQEQFIKDTKSNSFAKAMSSVAKNAEGYNPTFAIIDEYHESKSRAMYNSISKGMGQQKNGLLAIISTAGENLNVPMFEEYEMCKSILRKEKDADRYFIAIYELDAAAEIQDEKNWVKANPLLSDEIKFGQMKENMREEYETEKMRGSLYSLLTKNFNMWIQSSENAYMTISDWRNSQVEKKDINISGTKTWIGLDLSRTNDLSSVGWIHELEDGTKYIDSYSFIATYNEDIKSKSDREKIDYQRLIDNNLATVTDSISGIISKEQIMRYIFEYVELHNLDVQGFCYDAYSATECLSIIERKNLNWDIFDVKQDYRNMTVPIKALRDDLLERKVLHNENKLLEIAVNNAIITKNDDMLKINKKKNRNKIDPIISVIIAYKLAMIEEEETTQFYGVF
ncbi:terminase [Brochothrix thermosphacta]|uniref:Terminase n=1 Tax=Brochothrix thermosphacta TaxID=2756 RepID=A0A291BV56_BROTH|nr:terminase TerL endonuclease subunit [Brochothrix thermosphacta]ATF25054.1 terminase [Brochothrix thermosphacta]